MLPELAYISMTSRKLISLWRHVSAKRTKMNKHVSMAPQWANKMTTFGQKLNKMIKMTSFGDELTNWTVLQSVSRLGSACGSVSHLVSPLSSRLLARRCSSLGSRSSLGWRSSSLVHLSSSEAGTSHLVSQLALVSRPKTFDVFFRLSAKVGDELTHDATS